MTIAFVFPGQGSQSQGMQADLAERFPEVAETYAEASDILGYDLWSLAQEGPQERLGETVVTQPAMLTAGYAAWRCWNTAGGTRPAQLAGHSLGEYTALVCAGALSFGDALRLVIRRSELMQAAVPGHEGAMAAILGLDNDTIRSICKRVTEETGRVAESVNYNSPGQVVIAGHRDALRVAVDRLKEAGAKRAIVLPVSVPSHSSLMRDAGEQLEEALAAADINAPEITVINATDATPYVDVDDVRTRLSRQVYRHVHWVNTIRAMLDGGATSLVECGPGKVLTGLMRRIDRSMPAFFIDSTESLQKALQA